MSRSNTSTLPLMVLMVLLLVATTIIFERASLRGWSSGPWPVEHTHMTTTDHTNYVTQDWFGPDGRECGEVLKWKVYDYLPTEPRGYKVNIWGESEDHMFGTLQDADQFVELNWCKP